MRIPCVAFVQSKQPAHALNKSHFSVAGQSRTPGNPNTLARTRSISISYLFERFFIPDILHVVQIIRCIIFETSHMTFVELVQHFLGQRCRMLLRVLMPADYLKVQNRNLVIHFVDHPRPVRRCVHGLIYYFVLTTVIPNMSTNKRDASPITMTAIAHCGNNISDSMARIGAAVFCITANIKVD